MSNGNGVMLNETVDREMLAHSVTRAEKEAQKPEGGMVRFYIGAYSGGTSTVFNLLPDLPPFWSFVRDRILVSTVTVESRWAQAVGIACMKFATRQWDVSGEVPTTRLDKARRRVKSLMKPQSRMRVATDYTLRDNGSWVEIVRPTSQPTGLIGLNVLDASRCMPTGDPTIPVVYWDRLGHPHEMRDYQVIRFVDMPDGANPFGTGLCAARRAYNTIRQTAAVERFRLEKITGNNPKSIYFVTGVTPKQVKDLLLDHEQKQQADNIVAFGGVVIAPFIQREGITSVEIPIAALPDGFDYKTEMQSTAVAYANALNGVTYLDLMPMTGQRAGSSAQSQVVDDQSAQKDTLNADLVDQLNDDELYKVMPEGVSFFVKGNDMADKERMAKVTLAFSQAAGILVQQAQIKPQVIADWLIDNEILSPDENSEKYNTLEGDEAVAQGDGGTSNLIAPAPQPTQPDASRPMPSAMKLKAVADTIRALTTNGAEIPTWQLEQVVQDALGSEIVIVKTKDTQPAIQENGDEEMNVADAMKIGIEMARLQSDAMYKGIELARSLDATGTKQVASPIPTVPPIENHTHLDRVVMDAPASLIDAIRNVPQPQVTVDVPAPIVNVAPVTVDTQPFADALNTLATAVKSQKPPQVTIAGDSTETLKVVRDSDGLIDRIVRTVSRKA